MNKVIEFLKATGNDLPVDIDRHEFFKQVAKLLPLLKEEVLELEEALATKDTVGVVDALSDIRVYMDQFNYLQDKAGIDRVGVDEAVDLNNSLKWTTNHCLAMSWLFDLEYQDIGISENSFVVEGVDGTVSSYKAYCLKDMRGKVRKYNNFPKVDLTEFIPKELIKPTWDSFFKTRFEKISTQEEYSALKCSGMAYEVEPELEDTWQEFCIAKEKWLNSKLEDA